MTLSDAIQIGCKGKKQIKGSYYDGRGGVCALGAAICALDPERLGQSCLTPFNGSDNTLWKVTDWNDKKGYSFETIIALLKAEGK